MRLTAVCGGNHDHGGGGGVVDEDCFVDFIGIVAAGGVFAGVRADDLHCRVVVLLH